MTRILADLSEDDVQWLDAQAAEQGTSRAALLRQAVSVFRMQASEDWIQRGLGHWRQTDRRSDRQDQGRNG